MRKARSDDNRRKIIECADKLISEKGFADVTVAEITAAAGVSKGAFYIHFKSKEDIIRQKISLFYDDMKCAEDAPAVKRLEVFLTASVQHIVKCGIRTAQEWFSESVRGSVFGRSKLEYDLRSVAEIVGDRALAEEIVGVYYGALNLWCFTDGAIDPGPVIKKYLGELKL